MLVIGTGIDERDSDCDLAEDEVQEVKRQNLINPHDWPFQVLGFTNAREVIIWHQGQIMPIKAREIGRADINLLVGTKSGEYWEATRGAIIAEAHRKGKIDEDKPLQTGVWKLKDKWLVIDFLRN